MAVLPKLMPRCIVAMVLFLGYEDPFNISDPTDTNVVAQDQETTWVAPAFPLNLHIVKTAPPYTESPALLVPTMPTPTKIAERFLLTAAGVELLSQNKTAEWPTSTRGVWRNNGRQRRELNLPLNPQRRGFKVLQVHRVAVGRHTLRRQRL